MHATPHHSHETASTILADGVLTPMYAARAQSLGPRLRELTHVEAVLDGSMDSILRLEAVIQEFRSDLADFSDLKVGIGAYVGEILRQRLGGHWTANGRLINLGPKGVCVCPADKARLRLQEGIEHHLYFWLDAVAANARGGVVGAL